jgi:hypothetical protein
LNTERVSISALFALAIGASSITPLRASIAAIVDAARHGGEDLALARRRCMPGYAEGIDEIRRALPESTEYLLVEGADSSSFIFVQYDLAPRRALNLGWYVTPDELRARGRPERGPSWVVVARGPDARPLLVSADEFFSGAPGP